MMRSWRGGHSVPVRFLADCPMGHKQLRSSCGQGNFCKALNFGKFSDRFAVLKQTTTSYVSRHSNMRTTLFVANFQQQQMSSLGEQRPMQLFEAFKTLLITSKTWKLRLSWPSSAKTEVEVETETEWSVSRLTILMKKLRRSSMR